MSIPMTIGEIADRFSICKLKSERTDIDCSKELCLLEKELSHYPEISIYIDQLYEINGSIWHLESDIRLGKEGKLGLEEVGRRAIKIRNFNGMRVSTKNTINQLYNQGFFEQKSDHASQT
jgi:hypothetical protein